MVADERGIRPRGRYRMVVIDGDLFSTSAIGPMASDTETGFSHHGRVGAELTLDECRAAARSAADAVIAALREELGGLGRVRSIHHVRGFLAAAGGFSEHATVLDAASDVIVDALPQCGEHARSAVGVATLPFHVPIVIQVEGRLAEAER